MYNLGNDDDGFNYDVISCGSSWSRPLRVRSLVELIPQLATLTIEPEILNRRLGF